MASTNRDQRGYEDLSPSERRELDDAKRIAGRYSLEETDMMRRRTERRIDLAEPGPRSKVIALAYATAGFYAPLPVALAMPVLRPAAVLLALLGVFMFFWLRRAKRDLRTAYGTHRSWSILSIAYGLSLIASKT